MLPAPLSCLILSSCLTDVCAMPQMARQGPAVPPYLHFADAADQEEACPQPTALPALLSAVFSAAPQQQSQPLPLPPRPPQAAALLPSLQQQLYPAPNPSGPARQPASAALAFVPHPPLPPHPLTRFAPPNSRCPDNMYSAEDSKHRLPPDLAEHRLSDAPCTSSAQSSPSTYSHVVDKASHSGSRSRQSSPGVAAAAAAEASEHSHRSACAQCGEDEEAGWDDNELLEQSPRPARPLLPTLPHTAARPTPLQQQHAQHPADSLSSHLLTRRKLEWQLQQPAPGCQDGNVINVQHDKAQQQQPPQQQQQPCHSASLQRHASAEGQPAEQPHMRRSPLHAQMQSGNPVGPTAAWPGQPEQQGAGPLPGQQQVQREGERVWIQAGCPPLGKQHQPRSPQVLCSAYRSQLPHHAAEQRNAASASMAFPAGNQSVYFAWL